MKNPPCFCGEEDVSENRQPMKQLPSITIAIPTLNEEKRIAACLESVFCQEYPRKKLEVIVVDHYSEDETVQIAQKYPVKILYNDAPRGTGEFGKMIAFRKARGELFYYLDADVELVGKNWFMKMIKPLLENPDIIASFTHKFQKTGSRPLNRYLTYHFTQCDPIYEFFSVSIPSTVIEKRRGYNICFFRSGQIPPEGRCLYWRKKLLKAGIAKMDKFMELDILEILAKFGYQKFAWVPSAGIYHTHAHGLKQLFKKRLRNVNEVYLPDYAHRHFTWFDFRSPKGILKILIWVIYAHLIFPSILKGIYKSLKYKDIYCLIYEPILTVALTDVIIYGFLKNPKGRKLIFEIIKCLLKTI